MEVSGEKPSSLNMAWWFFNPKAHRNHLRISSRRSGKSLRGYVSPKLPRIGQAAGSCATDKSKTVLSYSKFSSSVTLATSQVLKSHCA
jgi:hypothetical protein